MEFCRKNWDFDDIFELTSCLEAFSNTNRIQWASNLIKTKNKVLAVPTKTLRQICKKIKKGNLENFIEQMLLFFESKKAIIYHEHTIILGSLICELKFEIMILYLARFYNFIDNWATCDMMPFKINEHNAKLYLQLANNQLNNKKVFVKRMGLIILIKLLNYGCILDALAAINLLSNEQEYYVNMAGAWLLAESFIKYKSDTILFLNKNTTNHFIINKGIQKCRESYRVLKEDKQFLIQYKTTNNK